MSFGFSIGDIILCSQITHRLFVAATSGRKDAPRKLQELEHILFGLNCSLDHLQKACQAGLSNSNNDVNMHHQLRMMLLSCRRTLEQLETVTEPYRQATEDPVSTPIDIKHPRKASREIIAHVKIHWRRFLWDFQGRTMSQYRYKLQSHTDSINLMLGSLIWYEHGRARSGPFHL